jgi:sulfopyruvate decarboxylase TPP-binding subunit
MPAKVIPRETPGDHSLLRQSSERIVHALDKMGITHAVGLPDNATRFLFELLWLHSRIRVVPVCREGEAWAIACGLWVGGNVPVVIIQNTGFLESGDAVRGTAIEMAVPLLAIMDYRGYHTLSQADPGAQDSAATFFEPTLQAWQMPYRFLEEGKEAEGIQMAFRQANQESRPVAVLIR